MHICTQINNGNNDPIKVFMTFICDDGMKNKNRKEKKEIIIIKWGNAMDGFELT